MFSVKLSGEIRTIQTGTVANKIRNKNKRTCVGGIAVSQARNSAQTCMTCEEIVSHNVRQA